MAFGITKKIADRLGIGKKQTISSLSRDAVNWFKGKTARGIMKDKKSVAIPELGKMYLFMYDAKHKETLPYWDATPLIVVIKRSKGSVWGLNLHYLPPTIRLQFLAALMQYANNDKQDATTRIKVTYSFLKSAAKLKAFRPCLKRYLVSNTRTQFAQITPDEWKLVAMLPLARWKNAGKNAAYKDSRGMI